MPSAPTRSMSHLLSSGYQPVAEEFTVPAPRVRGRLPRELHGTFLQIGANSIDPYDPARDSSMTGDAMVHGLRLRDGHVEWYRNRWLRTDRVAARLGELPAPGPRRPAGDNANAGLVRHGGRTLALGDGGVLPVQLGPDLETVARIDFDGTLAGGFSAQPISDPVTGELHAVAYEPGRPHVLLLTLDVQGRVRDSRCVPVKNTPMMHAFSLTARHAVLYDLPVTFHEDPEGGDPRFPYRWDDSHGARLGVMPRDGGEAEVLWMEVDPCYVFHPVNAYDEGDLTVVDVIRHERVFDRDRLHPSESVPTLWRWTADRRRGVVSEQQLSTRVQEFPSIDERWSGIRHRWAFTVGLRPDQSSALAGPVLLRHDLDTGTVEVREFGPGREAGRAVFVARSPRAPEGDGWLLTLVHDTAEGVSELVVIDTADFSGPAAARVPLPVRVPHGFQSAWIAGS